MADRRATTTLTTVTVDGNRLTLLASGRERLAEILAMIAGARRSLRLLFYIYSPDECGTAVRDALADAAKRGVDVSILLDGFGCGDIDSAFFEPIRAAGGDYCIFHPRVGRRYLIRNHQKLLIADERIGLIGGANIDRHYLEDEGKERWRDLFLKIEGDSIAHLAAYFDALERWTRKPKGRIRELRRLITRFSQTRGALQWKFSGPMRRHNPWPVSIVKDILAAHQLDIVAAYFSPSWAMLGRIASVVRRGGTARVVTASKSDNPATIAAARFTYRKLLRGGVRMFEYSPAKLHTKLYIADDIVHLGSANFDFRSIYLNLEMMLRVDDPKFASMMRCHVEREIADSAEITIEVHNRRSQPWRRAKWATSYFLVTSMDYTVTRRLNFGTE